MMAKYDVDTDGTSFLHNDHANNFEDANDIIHGIWDSNSCNFIEISIE